MYEQDFLDIGEPDRGRTCDNLIKSQVLYQLSYGPIRAAGVIPGTVAVSGAWALDGIGAVGTPLGPHIRQWAPDPDLRRKIGPDSPRVNHLQA